MGSALRKAGKKASAAKKVQRISDNVSSGLARLQEKEREEIRALRERSRTGFVNPDGTPVGTMKLVLLNPFPPAESCLLQGENAEIPPEFGHCHIVGYDDKVTLLDQHKHWDRRASMPVDTGLAASILQDGLLHPIWLQKNEKGIAEVVFGRQRVKAARHARKWQIDNAKPETELVVVPARLAPAGMTKAQIMAIAVAENSQRQDNTPEQDMDAAAHYALCNGDDEDTLKRYSVSSGHSVQRIRDMLRLREAHPELLEAPSDEVGFEAKIQIARHPVSEQPRLLEAMRAEAKEAGKLNADGKPLVSAQHARNRVRNARMRPMARTVTTLSDVIETNGGAYSAVEVATLLRWSLGKAGVAELPELLQKALKTIIEDAESRAQERAAARAAKAAEQGLDEPDELVVADEGDGVEDVNE